MSAVSLWLRLYYGIRAAWKMACIGWARPGFVYNEQDQYNAEALLARLYVWGAVERTVTGQKVAGPFCRYCLQYAEGPGALAAIIHDAECPWPKVTYYSRFSGPGLHWRGR